MECRLQSVRYDCRTLTNRLIADVSRDGGVIRIKRDLKEPVRNRARRHYAEQSEEVRSKRAVSSEEMLMIKACSGISQSQCNTVTVVIAIPGAGAVTDNIIETPGKPSPPTRKSLCLPSPIVLTRRLPFF